MALLALDASTEACAVGIQTQSGGLFQEFEIAPRQHTQLLPKMLDCVLLRSGINKQDIQGCIVGVGPGAFTGIRIGVAMTQGIALGLNVPCYAVSALQAIAQQALIETPSLSGHVLATIDARMQEIYFAYYSIEIDNKTELIDKESLIASDQFILSEPCKAIVGTGTHCIEAHFSSHQKLYLQNDCYPTAESLLRIYHQHDLTAIAPEHIQASYIRNQVVHQAKPKHV